MRTAETVIREKRLALLKRMNETMKKYDQLNDAEYILSKNIAEVRRVIAKYKDELTKPMLQFFLGDGKEYSQIDKMVWDAQKEFDKALSQFDIVPKAPRTDAMLTAIRKEYTTRVMGQINNTFADLTSKAVQFKTLANAARIPLVAADNVSRVLRGVTIDGVTYDGTKTERLWDMMTERYGRSDTVRYSRNGAGYNFPMRAYVDMRTQTTAGEVSRMVNAVEAAANDIYTGRISKHGAIDSCRYWEGKIVFYSDIAKQTFLTKYPQYEAAKDWPTLQEVEKDKTHIFLPNCKHRVLPYPIDLMTEKRAMSEIEANTMPDIPDKIKEPEAA